VPGTQPVVKECGACQESVDDHGHFGFRRRFSFQLRRFLLIFIQELRKFALCECAECGQQQRRKFTRQQGGKEVNIPEFIASRLPALCSLSQSKHLPAGFSDFNQPDFNRVFFFLNIEGGVPEQRKIKESAGRPSRKRP
jgi:hypothetical protein